MSRSPGSTYIDPLVVTTTTGPRLRSEEATHQVHAALEVLLKNTLRVGLVARQHTFHINNPVSGVVEGHTVNGVADSSGPFVATPVARARAFRVPERADGDIIAALREYDQPRGNSTGRREQFWRSSSRLKAAHEKAQTMKSPSLVVSAYQTPTAFSFGSSVVPAERPLKASALGAIDVASRRIPQPYRQRMEEAIELADYTHHDPETLHPRFLNYVNERITDVDDRTRASMRGAAAAQRKMWRDCGVCALARPLSDAEPKPLGAMVNKGSPGEYRELGVTDRRDPRLVDLMSRSLVRYAHVGKLRSLGKRDPQWVSVTQQPTLTFGKEEPKPGKRRADGTIEPPVPRFIFNLSPVNYALAIFLHGDISHSLQECDPTHGPGFGPGRGRSGKFLNVVENAFKGGFVVPDDEPMVMSDIEKWDAFIREVLLELGIDNLERCVDKSGLDSPSLAARAAMMGVSKRQLLKKLVEHPSGYLVDLYGTMPSGSYYTSLLNTNCNNLLLTGHLIDRVAEETNYTVAGAAEAVAGIAPGLMVSYGDNQLFSARLFKFFGITYSPDLHAEYLSRFGMKLKVSETEVTTRIDRVRFCSRAVVRTPEGLLITRTHSSMYQKLAARPEHDPIIDKLYVRAIMCDAMGTDPILYDAMSLVDRQIDVDIDIAAVTPRVRAAVSSVAESFYGSSDDQAILNTLDAISRSTVDRRALLSLHTPRSYGTKRDLSLGTRLTAGDTLFGGPLTNAASWAYEQTPWSWEKYVRETGQEGVYWE